MEKIYILECDNSEFPGVRSLYYIMGQDNAYAEYEDALKEGLRPHIYSTEVTPTGLIMRGNYIM